MGDDPQVRGDYPRATMSVETDFEHLRKQLRAMALKYDNESHSLIQEIDLVPDGRGAAASVQGRRRRDRLLGASAMNNAIALGILLALDALNAHIEYLMKNIDGPAK